MYTALPTSLKHHVFQQLRTVSVCIIEQVPTRILMGPGPANPHPRVLTAQALPMLGHMHPPFFKIMDGRSCPTYPLKQAQAIQPTA